MRLFELGIIALGLSMDAFAVAVCKGLSMPKPTANSKFVAIKSAVIVGLYFGGFQAAMPVVGYLLGAQFAGFVSDFASWIAFALLGIIGGKMIFESRKKNNDHHSASLGPKAMLPLALATSIDALATGVGFAFLGVNIVLAAGLIGIITLAMSIAGIKIGNVFGLKFKSKAEFIGGVVLILMGLKILVEHLAFSA